PDGDDLPDLHAAQHHGCAHLQAPHRRSEAHDRAFALPKAAQARDDERRHQHGSASQCQRADAPGLSGAAGTPRGVGRAQGPSPAAAAKKRRTMLEACPASSSGVPIAVIVISLSSR
ncbi:MAG: hypothetical protein ACK56I_32540, partial [bacterium]